MSSLEGRRNKQSRLRDAGLSVAAALASVPSVGTAADTASMESISRVYQEAVSSAPNADTLEKLGVNIPDKEKSPGWREEYRESENVIDKRHETRQGLAAAIWAYLSGK